MMNWIRRVLVHGRQRLRAFSRDEGGVVLVFALLVLLILSAMALGILRLGASEPQIATNLLRSTQALGVAEAGVERAIAQFVANLDLVANAPGTCPAPDFSPLTVGSGTATVTYSCDGGFATVRIDSVGGLTGGNPQRLVRAIVTGNYVSEFGALGGTVLVGGSATIAGNRGSVHGNDGLTIEGSAYADLTATSSGGSCTGCTDPTYVGMPEGSGAGIPTQPIPAANPLDFVDQADFILTPAGAILDLRGGPPGVLVPENSGDFTGWTMGVGGSWQYSGGGGKTPPDGTYYTPYEMRITGGGTTMTPWKATFIAGTSPDTGSVQLSGNPKIEAYLDDLLILAGDADLIHLAGSASLEGVIMATDPNATVTITGNVTLTGNIITPGTIDISGSANITYNIGTRTPFIGPLTVLSWTTIPQ